MENTVAFSYLLDLITVVGSFFTTPFVFGLSILQLAIICTTSYFLLNILLGSSISPRSTSSKEEEQ